MLIPEKLYGREREIDALLAAFDRVVAQGTAELVLVSGYSGVGKSSVVNELHKVLVPPRGLFAAGKFDQYKRDVPYATLAQAFQMLVRQILVASEAEVNHWRHALLEALGPNGQLMVNLIPEVEFVIGKQPPVAELPPQEARGRFQLVFRRFLGAFARPEHPLALFLDDLQWLDTATLELLERLITDPDVRHVLLIGAYALLMVVPGNIPRLTQTDGLNQALPLVDWRVAGFTVGIAFLTAILFGLFPSLFFSNPILLPLSKRVGDRRRHLWPTLALLPGDRRSRSGDARGGHRAVGCIQPGPPRVSWIQVFPQR